MTLEEPCGPRPTFLVQTARSKGTEYVRAAALRRGWREVSAGLDAAHVRTCLAGPRGLRFCWLRSHDPLVHNYPSEMHAVTNRWPARTADGTGFGLGGLWRKDGLLHTLSAYYAAQGLDPWAFHPLSMALPQGATGAHWEVFRATFDAVGRAIDPRVPAEQCEVNLWLLKPSAGSCGRGIGLAATLEGLEAHWHG